VLLYRNLFSFMAVEIEPGPTFRTSTPKLLFTARVGFPTGDYDVSADGKRFLLVKLGSDVETGPPQAHFIFEWFEELQRRMRAGR
jgi:hypothetical protein